MKNFRKCWKFPGGEVIEIVAFDDFDVEQGFGGVHMSLELSESQHQYNTNPTCIDYFVDSKQGAKEFRDILDTLIKAATRLRSSIPRKKRYS